jgi:hypothetical protein
MRIEQNHRKWIHSAHAETLAAYIPAVKVCNLRSPPVRPNVDGSPGDWKAWPRGDRGAGTRRRDLHRELPFLREEFMGT